MAKLIAFTTDEGEMWQKVDPSLWVTSMELRQYPPAIFKLIPQLTERPNYLWRGTHDSIPFVFFALLFDDGSVWDTHLANEGDPWRELPSDILSEILQALRSGTGA